jgi:hypothetical protein
MKDHSARWVANGVLQGADRLAPGRRDPRQAERRAELLSQSPEVANRVASRRGAINLTDQDPAVLWQYHVQLVAVEQALKNLKGDLAIRPIFHKDEVRSCAGTGRVREYWRRGLRSSCPSLHRDREAARFAIGQPFVVVRLLWSALRNQCLRA